MKRRLLVGLSLAFLAAVGVFSYLDRAQAHVRITTDVTWSETIRPIFIQKCMPCHHPGSIAPDYVDLTFYGDDTTPGARAWATAIEEEVLTGRMPPWNADERFGEFSNEMTLTAEEIELITAWVEGGGPQGPMQNLPVPEQFLARDWSFGAPDIVVSMPKGHVVPADQQYDVATVRVPVEIEEDTYVTGYEFFVGNPKNVARVTAYIHDPEGRELEPIEVEVQKPYDPLAGEDELEETRMRPMPKGPHFLGQWTKGEGPVLFPEEAGRLLRKGSTIEMRIDYVRPMWADWSEEIRDSTLLGLFVAGPDEEVDLLVESKRIENPDFVIKAGKKKQVEAKMAFDESVHLIGVNPHLGPLATKFRVKLEYPDGLEKVLLWVPEFHQRWTMSYRFEEPVPAPAGTMMTLTGWYDNTADNWDNPNDPPADIATGPNWTDERLYAMVDYTLDDHLKTEDIIPVTEDAPSGGGMLGGFNPLSPKAGDLPEDDQTVQERAREIVDTLQIQDQPERIRPAINGYHQVQGMIKKPGHFTLYVYDNELNPLDPRNFSGEVVLENGETKPLVHHHPGDDYLSAWLTPTFPQEFEAKVVLGGGEEKFAFLFESLTEPASRGETGETAPSRQAFVQPPHGGWLDTLERTGHQVEATLEEPGRLRLYFFDTDMNPVDPRNFRGLAMVIDPQTGDPDGSKTLLSHPAPRAEFLEAKISPELPLTVRTRIWVGDGQEELEFEFEELTEEPWDFGFDNGAEEPAPLIVGPHGSPEFYAAGNGFHFVEAAMPRPGEFRLYFYDEWKNPVDPALFKGTIKAGSEKDQLVRFNKKDPYLTAFIKPAFPATIDASVWITGEQESFTFSFDEVTTDPAEVVDTAAAHMDHEPLHGGQFFMADNMFHHLEGTMPRPGEFRLYFYDNFKQPIDPRNFAGTAYIPRMNENTGEVTDEPFEMFHNKPSDMYLTARVPAEWPVTLFVMVNLGGEMKRFDFAFEELTVELARPRLAMAAQPGAGPVAAGDHSHYRPALAIPETIPEILNEIRQREQDLMRRITMGDWNTLYIPAWDVRDLVAALSDKQSGLTVREKGKFKMLVGAVNRTTNKIDGVAHTADPPRVQAVADELSEHIGELEAIFGAKA